MEVKEMVCKGQNINAQVYKGQVIVIPGGGGGDIDPEAIKEAVDEYLEANPPAQGAPGKDGQDGYTPVKYVDYFTPEEVEEIAQQAAGMVEVPEGGGSEWRLVEKVELNKDVSVVEVNISDPAQEVYVIMKTKAGYADGTELTGTATSGKITFGTIGANGNSNGNAAIARLSSFHGIQLFLSGFAYAKVVRGGVLALHWLVTDTTNAPAPCMTSHNSTTDVWAIASIRINSPYKYVSGSGDVGRIVSGSSMEVWAK